MRISLSVEGAQQYRDLAKRLRAAGPRGKQFRKKLRYSINEAGQPILQDVRSAVRGLQVTSHGGGTAQRRAFNVSRARNEKAAERAARRGAGLRHTIASATRLQITAKGVRFVTNSDRLPPDQRSLPRHLDSARGWRHPVFGNRSEWVTQKGGPWFAHTIMKGAPRFRAKIIKAMDETVREIEK
jgi:hypothetical protein